MEYRTLGHTDLKVSLLCLGSMTFGQQNTETEAHQQLDYATGRGINFIDCAEMYPVPASPKTQGLTEQYIGSWLKQRGQRDAIIIATKVTGPSGPQLAHLRGGPRLNHTQISEALHDSLRRLQTDYIDLYQVHWPERNTNYFGKLGYTPGDDRNAIPIAETLQTLHQLQQTGKIRHIGVSNETPWGIMQYLQLAANHKLPHIVSIQNPYNLLNRSYEIGLAEISCRENIGLLAYSPLAFGALTGKYQSDKPPADGRLSLWSQHFIRYTKPQGIAATRRYSAIAKRHGISPAQMALAYVNTRPFLTSNIIGATNLQQLAENIDSIKLKLSIKLLNEIESVHTEICNPAP